LKPFDPDILRSKVSVFVELFLQKEKIKEQAMLLREREREASRSARSNGSACWSTPCPSAYGPPTARATLTIATHLVEFSVSTRKRVGASGSRGAAETLERVERAIEDAFRNGTLLETRSLQTSEGRRVPWHLLRAVPEFDGTGKVTGWIATGDRHRRAQARRGGAHSAPHAKRKRRARKRKPPTA